MTQITAQQDARNRRTIASFPFPIHLNHRQALLDGGTPEERAAYVRGYYRLLIGFLAVFVAVWAALQAMPKTPVHAPIPPAIQSAGEVLGVDLHETATSTSSTVRTSRASFQVVGAVSWAPGDTATIHEEQEGVRKGSKKLCVSSQVKNGCYWLL